MLFHASSTPDLKTLIPHVSNHGTPLVYLSQKRENVLVYLSNPVEKYCKEMGFAHNAPYYRMASYGFNQYGILTLDEYYPNAAVDTYNGVKGYIYTANESDMFKQMNDIPFAFTSDKPVETTDCEYIPDAYAAILRAAEQGKIIITKYENNTPAKLEWIERIIKKEYEKSADHSEYRFFLKEKFDFLKRN